MARQSPIRGNIVRLRLGFDRQAHNPTEKFFELMYREASAVSSSNKPGVYQLPGVYYWRGAVVSQGFLMNENQPTGEQYHPDSIDFFIEIQKDGSKELLDGLVETLESEMQIKFNRRTVSKA
ncbi:hypothetical protein COU61_01655 [Candidatus Pacearchaeota archaeon CG10_big_fil_rev_8_21_14_0_10_35_13]|nr:MAG: hypothetical protein COU61_01655 [Candidatus Pacearchaeota archaeon CG10_big_fil_rev_8_21_14_0_10_35_13]